MGVEVIGQHRRAGAITFPLIKGVVQTSFIDWDGYISAVLFLGRCDFQCPFCHDHDLFGDKAPAVPFDLIEEACLSMKDWLDGIVVTGGEPTSNPGIGDLLSHVKSLGFKVKLDTNGSNPQMLRELVDRGLVDYVAMDVKTSLSREPVASAGSRKYDLAAGRSVDIDAIEKSIEFLLSDGVDYEFRTTAVPTIVGRCDVEDIARRIAGARRYFLQPFEPSHARSPLLRKVQPYALTEMNEMLASAREFVPQTSLRGKMRSSG